MPSKPIPIPPCNEADQRNDDDNEIASKAQMYDAATWRMYHLIWLSRSRASSVPPRPSLPLGPAPPPHHHVLLTHENDHTTIKPAQSSKQQPDDTREHSLPETPSLHRHSSHMDEVFIMD